MQPDQEDISSTANDKNTRTSRRRIKQPWRLLARIKRVFAQLFFSSLTRRIVILNLAALAILMAGIMFLNQFRDGLIDAKIESLRLQGQTLAGAIASASMSENNSLLPEPEELLERQARETGNTEPETTDSWDFPINPERVSPLLRHVISPTTTRVRIYDRDANLLIDSQYLYFSNQGFGNNSTPAQQEEKPGLFKRMSNWIASFINGDDAPIYKENATYNGHRIFEEVVRAMNGYTATAQRRNAQGGLVVSVAVPVNRSGKVVGVLLLSTVGSDIDAIVKGERMAIFRISAVVASVLLILSLFLAYTIANPLRKLAAAADRVRSGTTTRVQIPDFSDRQDEVGHLSTSIRDMTNALYARIEAIESFAADVSHELKNPLTSLRSAVETLPIAKTDEARTRLFEIVQHDVKRLDRLITDIASASRLDAELAREDSHNVDLEALLSSLVRGAQEVSRHKNSAEVTLEVAPPEAPCKDYQIQGHDLRLGQVISNLIENARSFINPENGKIKLKMFCHQGHIRITVEDNGPGIRAENIDRIFERFYTDRPASEGFGQNSGLGLSISRQIVEAHDGQLWAENIVNPENPDLCIGARFIIDLPYKKNIKK